MTNGRLIRWTLAALAAGAAAGPSAATGTVGFSRADVPVLHSGSGTPPQSVELADLDEQKGKDIVLALPGQSSVGVMLNDGNGNFDAMTEYPTNCPAQSVVDITLGDVTSLASGGLNPDGHVDAYVACTPNVVRLRGNGHGALTNPEPFNLGLAQYLGSGTLDLLTLVRRADGASSPLLIVQADAGGNGQRKVCAAFDLDPASLHCDTTTQGSGPFATGDLNGTSAGVPPDEIVTGEAGGKLGVFGYFIPPFGPGAGQLTWSDSSRDVPGDPQAIGTSTGIESATVGDLEPDGDLDVLVGQNMNSADLDVDSIHYFKWIAGTGLEQNARTLVSTRGLDDVAIADIDSDGCNDVVGAGDYGRGRVHLGDGQGNFDGGRDLQQIGYVNDGSFATRVTMAISDLNGDAKPDLVISDQLSNKVMVFSNTSTTAGAPCHDEPPQAVGDQATVTEDSGPTDTGVLGNDVNSDGGPKTVASVIPPSHGTAAITGGGTGVSYQPAANYCGSDSFTYTLNGGSSATVSLTVTCVDDQPVAANDSTTVDQGSAAAAIDVLANDTDSDGGPKLVASATPPAHGTVSITGGGTGLTYQPNAGYCGSDTFTYTLNGGSVGTVSVSVACAPPPPRTCADPGTIAALVGTAGDDVLVGTAGRDVISGRGGDDCIFGRSGDDRLDGGTGADLIRGSTGSDRMNGSAGNDKVDGGTGNDTITPGSGKDRVIAGGGNDEISARDGARDTIDCGAGKDKVTADRTDKVNSNCENVKRAERRRR